MEAEPLESERKKAFPQVVDFIDLVYQVCRTRMGNRFVRNFEDVGCEPSSEKLRIVLLLLQLFFCAYNHTPTYTLFLISVAHTQHLCSHLWQRAVVMGPLLSSNQFCHQINSVIKSNLSPDHHQRREHICAPSDKTCPLRGLPVRENLLVIDIYTNTTTWWDFSQRRWV